MAGPITFPLHPAPSAIPVRGPSAIVVAKKELPSSLPTGAHAPKDSHDPTVPARDFEALLIGQMLRSAHASEDPEDATSDTMWDMAAQQFSRVLADNGGLGLARIITQGLKTKAEAEPSAASDATGTPAKPQDMSTGTK